MEKEKILKEFTELFPDEYKLSNDCYGDGSIYYWLGSKVDEISKNSISKDTLIKTLTSLKHDEHDWKAKNNLIDVIINFIKQ